MCQVQSSKISTSAFTLSHININLVPPINSLCLGSLYLLTDSKPKEGIVFAVCIFAVGEDGTKYLVDHRHAENMGECIKKR